MLRGSRPAAFFFPCGIAECGIDVCGRDDLFCSELVVDNGADEGVEALVD